MESPAAKRAKTNETVNPVTPPEICESGFVAVVKEESEEKDEPEVDKTEKSTPPLDLFHYPKPTDYAFIVANGIVPLATPDKWRHSMSSILNRAGAKLRVTIMGCEFPGRCFDCKLNNKSVCFCFFGQNTKDGDEGVALTSVLQERLRRIDIFAKAQRDEENFYKAKQAQGFVRGDSLMREWFALNADARLGYATGTTSPVENFPDPDIIFKVKSVKRVSKQHYLPPVVNLLCQAPFTEYFDEHTFDGFLRTQKVIDIVFSTTGSSKWCEPASNVSCRSAALKGVRRMSSEHDRRARVALIMSGLYNQWTSPKAGEKCNESCRVGGCVDCSRVRSALKREYKEQVRTVIDNRISQLFMASKGPFECFDHKTFNGEFYEDEHCRVVRIRAEP